MKESYSTVRLVPGPSNRDIIKRISLSLSLFLSLSRTLSLSLSRKCTCGQDMRSGHVDRTLEGAPKCGQGHIWEM